MTTTYTADSPEVQAFLVAWHENGRASFERDCPNLNWDTYEPHAAKDRRRFVALDRGGSGCFLLEKTTGMVYSIKAYGVPKRPIKHLALMTADYLAATASQRRIRP